MRWGHECYPLILYQDLCDLSCSLCLFYKSGKPNICCANIYNLYIIMIKYSIYLYFVAFFISSDYFYCMSIFIRYQNSYALLLLFAD